jgi:hypothetical protein
MRYGLLVTIMVIIIGSPVGKTFAGGICCPDGQIKVGGYCIPCYCSIGYQNGVCVTGNSDTAFTTITVLEDTPIYIGCENPNNGQLSIGQGSQTGLGGGVVTAELEFDAETGLFCTGPLEVDTTTDVECFQNGKVTGDPVVSYPKYFFQTIQGNATSARMWGCINSTCENIITVENNHGEKSFVVDEDATIDCYEVSEVSLAALEECVDIDTCQPTGACEVLGQ